MLKQRLITAAILIPLVVAGLLYLPTLIIADFLALVCGLAAWEWLVMVGMALKVRIITLVVLVSTVLLGYFYGLNIGIIAGGVFWLLATAMVVRYAHVGLPKTLQQRLKQPLFSVICLALVLLPFAWAGLWLHSSGDLGGKQLLSVLVLTWLADTGGYFAGKRWGQRKLATAISPNKTWEGLAGGVVLGGVWAILTHAWGWAGELSLFAWCVLSLVALLFSVAGDLFESIFKRLHDVKDSGNLLPGHGGILDRIDSLTAAVPVFVLGLWLLG